MRIFNTDISRAELQRRVGNLAQIGSVELLSHEQGYARGSRFLDFRTGSGFRFSVHVDRGMDPGFGEFAGANLAWLPPKLFPAPAYWENDDHAWVRWAMGGLCNTAGLVTIGSPQTVDVSSFQFHARADDRFGTHDRIAMIPASHFNFGQRWDGDRCFLWAEGTVRQEIVYGENLLLTRRYEAEMGGNSFTLRDVVRNDGFYPTPHQILYHFNIGYPVVDDGAELLAAVTGDVPGSMFADEEGASERYRTFSGPEKEFVAEGYEIPLATGTDGWSAAAVVNRGFKGIDGGLGVFLRYGPATLPKYIEWRMMGESLYAVGMEPSSNGFKPIPELIEEGYPIMLEPGEERVYELEFGVLPGGAAIDAFAAALPVVERRPELMAGIAIPSLGIAMEEALLVKWHRQPGDEVAANDPVAEIETDKATMDLESPVAGRLGPHLFGPGATVPVGVVIVEVLAEGEEAAEPVAAAPVAPQAVPSSPEPEPAVPVAAQPVTAQPDGRRPHTMSPRARRLAAAAADGAAPVAERFRDLIATKVSESWRQIPHFAVTRKVDAEPMLKLLAAQRASGVEPAPTLTDLMLRALALALREVGDGAGGDVGLAVASEHGVLIPVVRGVLDLDAGGLAAARAAAVARARAGRLNQDDLTAQPPSTLSNLGALGVDQFTGVIALGQTSLLTVGRAIPRVVADGDSTLSVRTMFHATLNADHRTIDGAGAARLLVAFALAAEGAGSNPQGGTHG